MTERLRIRGGPRAAGEARAGCAAALGERAGMDALRDLQLLVSEVVNNSVVHGGVGDDGWIELSIAVDGGLVRVEVRDDGRQGEPVARSPDFDNGGGFGLFLVEAMASSWGSARDPDLTVWFEMNLAE